MRLADQHSPALSAHKVTEEQKWLGRYISGSGEPKSDLPTYI